MGAYKDVVSCPSCGYRIDRSKGDYDDYCPKCGEFLEDYVSDNLGFDDDVNFDDSDWEDSYSFDNDYE